MNLKITFIVVDFLRAAVEPGFPEGTAIRAHRQQARSRQAGRTCAPTAGGPPLRTGNENAQTRMRPCSARRSHSHRVEFILQGSRDQQKIIPQNPAMTLDLSQKEEWEVT